MLTKKSQYAFKALSYLASKQVGEPVLISEIAAERKIPIKFLESILLELKNDGILGSKKGKGGGYFFNEDPANIKMARVIRLIDGPISMLPCVSLYFYERCSNCNEGYCGLHDVMVEVRDATLAILENRSLKDIRDNYTGL